MGKRVRDLRPGDVEGAMGSVAGTYRIMFVFGVGDEVVVWFGLG